MQGVVALLPILLPGLEQELLERCDGFLAGFFDDILQQGREPGPVVRVGQEPLHKIAKDHRFGQAQGKQQGLPPPALGKVFHQHRRPLRAVVDIQG